MRFLKFTLLALLILGASLSARAFSLLGPIDTQYQIERIGYDLAGDIGGPMNVGEEYRWNTPYITYGFDQSFTDYFGTNGIAAVEQAIAILNALPKMSELNLNNYPFESIRVNYLADSLSLLDVKSTVLSVLLEELGLAEPERYVWTLASRNVTGSGASQATNWFVIQRNFDPVTYEPTAYINGKLYIYDSITEQQDPDIDFPNVITADPLAYPFASTVAGGLGRGGSGRGLASGAFFTGLTYDDVGGLKYLIRTNNFNVENLLPDVREVYTNTAPEQLITQDYCLLLERSQNSTNDPATLRAFPGYGNLNITSTNITFVNTISTNYTVYLTNINFTSKLVVETNYTTTVTTNYDYTFDNVFFYTTNSERVFTNIVSTVQLAPVYSVETGIFQTNIVTTVLITNMDCGEFYIVPTNLLNFVELTPLLTNTVGATNFSFVPISQILAQEDRSTGYDLFITTDLTTFDDQARTNDPSVFQALYPDLLILSTNRYFTNIVTTNWVFYFTNAVWIDPFSYIVVSNAVPETNVTTNYNYVFGNVVTNTLFTSGPVTVEITKTTGNYYDPAGSFPNPVTTSTTYISNYLNGSIYIVPTNLFGYNIVETQWVESVTYTNFVDFGTNFFQFTNTDFTAILRYSTNYYLKGYPIYNLSSNTFGSNTFGVFTEVDGSATSTFLQYKSVGLRVPTYVGGLRPGVDKLTFVRVEPAAYGDTNTYSVYTNQYIDTVIISNSVDGIIITNQVVQRTSRQPDILFRAADLRDVDDEPEILARTSTAGWINNNTINSQANLAGPGIITPQVQITLSKIGPFQYNYHFGNTFFTGQQSSGFLFTWGSFDGSTNTPIVYPVGTTIPPDAGP